MRMKLNACTIILSRYGDWPSLFRVNPLPRLRAMQPFLTSQECTYNFDIPSSYCNLLCTVRQLPVINFILKDAKENVFVVRKLKRNGKIEENPNNEVLKYSVSIL